MATSQVYYVPWEGGILCSTDLRVLLRLADGIGINEEAVPLHLMFRILPGPMTYFKDVSRMFPGEIITWHDNALEIRHSRDMYCPAEKPAYDHLDSAVYEEYFEKLSAIMRSYVREIERRKGRIANELSGGVDSSLIQLLIRQQTSGDEASPSFSFTFEPEGFQFEVGYARMASELLGTRHTFVDVQSRDYADLLVKTIQTLAQPMVIAENDPGHLVLAEHLAASCAVPHYVFAGQGADVLQGEDVEECIANLDALHYAFGESWRLFGTPIFRKKLGGLLDVSRYVFMASTYRCLHTPADLFDPVNRVAVPYTSFETLRHFLGDEVVLGCLEYRQSLTEETLTSHTLVEHLHDIDMITLGYGPATAFEALFAAANEVLIPFYFDQEVVRLAKSVSPEVRYRQDNEVKPIPKSILRLKSLDQIVHQRKGSSGFWRDFQSWMMNGMLREMVHSIERPGFISQKDFAALIENKYPYGYDLVWPLLTYDIFQKHVVRPPRPESAVQIWNHGDDPPPFGPRGDVGHGVVHRA
jgi:asparagine synthetase B (glutamine-hydrolysing)